MLQFCPLISEILQVKFYLMVRSAKGVSFWVIQGIKEGSDDLRQNLLLAFIVQFTLFSCKFGQGVKHACVNILTFSMSVSIKCLKWSLQQLTSYKILLTLYRQTSIRSGSVEDKPCLGKTNVIFFSSDQWTILFTNFRGIKRTRLRLDLFIPLKIVTCLTFYTVYIIKQQQQQITVQKKCD